MSELEQHKAIVIQFLEQCNQYALDKLAGYAEQQSSAPSMASLEIDAKIGQWRSYFAFNEFAIAELRSTELDHWFGKPNG